MFYFKNIPNVLSVDRKNVIYINNISLRPTVIMSQLSLTPDGLKYAYKKPYNWIYQSESKKFVFHSVD